MYKPLPRASSGRYRVHVSRPTASPSEPSLIGDSSSRSAPQGVVGEDGVGGGSNCFRGKAGEERVVEANDGSQGVGELKVDGVSRS